MIDGEAMFGLNGITAIRFSAWMSEVKRCFASLSSVTVDALFGAPL